MGIEYIITLLKEVFHTPNDGLRIEITIETLIEASFEIEEEEHLFCSAYSVVFSLNSPIAIGEFGSIIYHAS